MTDRAAILIRALQLESENILLRAALGERRAIPIEAIPLIAHLRARGQFWKDIGAVFGVSGEAARRYHNKVRR